MEKITVPRIIEKKKNKTPIVALTCYDWFSGLLVDQSGVDLALVGDSLANTRLGYPTTLPVTIEEMLHHTKASARGVKRALLVADMPFQSYEYAPWEAAKTAGRFVKEGGAQAVKVEGGQRVLKSIEAILKANVPVLGHLGLTPQSVHIKGGYKVQGKSAPEAEVLIKEAKKLEESGIFGLVLEGIPSLLAKTISHTLHIPTIGIGAGPHCDGQILVLDDILGMNEGKAPKFVKKYVNLRPQMKEALSRFGKEVRSKRFPTKTHSY